MFSSVWDSDFCKFDFQTFGRKIVGISPKFIFYRQPGPDFSREREKTTYS